MLFIVRKRKIDASKYTEKKDYKVVVELSMNKVDTEVTTVVTFKGF